MSLRVEMTDKEVTISVELLEELVQVCSWHTILCNMVRNGDTYEMHPDKDSFNYLDDRARVIGDMAQECLPESDPFRVKNDS